MTITVDRSFIAPEICGSRWRTLVFIKTKFVNGRTNSIRVGRHYQILEGDKNGNK